MGLLLRSLTMLVLLTCFCLLPCLIRAQSRNESSRAANSLDSLLQDYAYRGFDKRPKTGVQYDSTVPSNLTGMSVAALRLRSGSLRRYGVQMYKEFVIPQGVIVEPYVERLVLVYQNLGNWSEFYYPLTGYSYLAPVVALLPYDANNLSASNLRELNIRASGDPISIIFSDARSALDGLRVRCVRFDPQGGVNFANVSSKNKCSAVEQGHFSIVVETVALAPAPSPSAIVPTSSPGGRAKKKASNSKVWIIFGSVAGGLVMMGLLWFLVLWAQKYKERKRMQQMETAAEGGEPLQIASVGDTKAPAARVTRTQPLLENEYMP